MGRFDDPVLKKAVFERDRYRCRWCGRHGEVTGSLDAHHIRFRRNESDDTMDNLISLCRRCHDWVHATHIPKRESQAILWELIDTPGVTGMQMLRWKQRGTYRGTSAQGD